jgi:hypothetical protein
VSPCLGGAAEQAAEAGDGTLLGAQRSGGAVDAAPLPRGLQAYHAGAGHLRGRHPRPPLREEPLQAGAYTRSTFWLNVSTICWIRWMHDFPPVFQTGGHAQVRPKQLRLSCEVNECKPPPPGAAAAAPVTPARQGPRCTPVPPPRAAPAAACRLATPPPPPPRRQPPLPPRPRPPAAPPPASPAAAAAAAVVGVVPVVQLID